MFPLSLSYAKVLSNSHSKNGYNRVNTISCDPSGQMAPVIP